jgi:hypothetical protein
MVRGAELGYLSHDRIYNQQLAAAVRDRLHIRQAGYEKKKFENRLLGPTN